MAIQIPVSLLVLGLSSMAFQALALPDKEAEERQDKLVYVPVPQQYQYPLQYQYPDQVAAAQFLYKQMALPYSLAYSQPQIQNLQQLQSSQVQIPQLLRAVEQPKQEGEGYRPGGSKDIPVVEGKEELNLQKFSLADVKGLESYYPQAPSVPQAPSAPQAAYLKAESNYQYFNTEDNQGSSYPTPHYAQQFEQNYINQEQPQVYRQPQAAAYIQPEQPQVYKQAQQGNSYLQGTAQTNYANLAGQNSYEQPSPSAGYKQLNYATVNSELFKPQPQQLQLNYPNPNQYSFNYQQLPQNYQYQLPSQANLEAVYNRQPEHGQNEIYRQPHFLAGPIRVGGYSGQQEYQQRPPQGYLQQEYLQRPPQQQGYDLGLEGGRRPFELYHQVPLRPSGPKGSKSSRSNYRTEEPSHYGRRVPKHAKGPWWAPTPLTRLSPPPQSKHHR